MKSRTGLIITIAALLPVLFPASQEVHPGGKTTPPFMNPSVSTEDRISDLLRRMSLDEKIAQLQSVLRDVEKETLIAGPGLGGVGPIMRGLDRMEAAAKANRIQRLIREKTRLQIPAILHDEALHGLIAKGATCFPQSIALASTWNPLLLEQIAAAIGQETRARGIRQILSPVVNIARDARWGRVEETYGEDPYLTSQLGVAFCRGVESQGVISTPKHYVANVGDGGRDSYPVHFSERLLREIYFPAFFACVREGGAHSVMAAYNSLDGLPCSSDRWLLTEVLRTEWGFQGFVVSDYGSAAGILNKHAVAAGEEEAAALAINAGLDVELPDVYLYGLPLRHAVQAGRVPGAALDDAVRRVLRAKIDIGLFDDPFVPEEPAAPEFLEEARRLALQSARESIVLLKNEPGTLPLPKDLRTIAVIGPLADAVRLGGYSGPGNNVVTVLQGIRESAGASTTVLHAKGCDLGFTSLPPIPERNLHPAGAKAGETGLKGEYFNNANLHGTPVIVRIDRQVQFEWGMGSPDPALPADRFSVRWTGTLLPDLSGQYRIGASTDDGVRLWVDGKLLLDSWYDRGATLDDVTITLQAGRRYDIRMEVYENTGWSYAALVWKRAAGEDPQIQEAVAAARKSAAAVIVAGITEGEGYDRADLNLPGDQELLIRSVAETGVPTVVILVVGSAVTMRNWIDNVGAVIDMWYGGDEGGRAVADVLFGSVNPSGKLPITFPRSVGQVPLYYNHKPTGRGDAYADMGGKPQFPFGHGLSYTTFQYDNLRISPGAIKAGEETIITVDLTNHGDREGDEVVQLYLRDIVGSVARPVLELRGFRRIHLPPGRRETVAFEIGPADLAFYDRTLRKVIEPGNVEILVGSSSDDIRAHGILEIIK